MARVEREHGVYRVIAESPEEHELLRHGQRDGELVLLEGYYPVCDGRVLLPDGISWRGAERVRQALEEAALSHREAQRRRGQFRLVRDSGGPAGRVGGRNK